MQSQSRGKGVADLAKGIFDLSQTRVYSERKLQTKEKLFYSQFESI